MSGRLRNVLLGTASGLLLAGYAGVTFADAVIGSYLSGVAPDSEAAPRPTRFSLTGYLFATVDPAFADEPARSLDGAIFVPGVTVRLVRGGSTIQTVRSDLSGRFRFTPQRTGKYQACWSGFGWATGCTSVALTSRHVVLAPLRIRPSRLLFTATVYGTVRFGDGSIPRTLEPLANVNAFTVVRSYNPRVKPIAPPAYVNNYGEYVLPRVPAGSGVRLRATIEKEIASGSVSAAAVPASRVVRINLRFKNRQPRLAGVPAQRPQGIQARALTSGGHWTVLPGEKVQLTANAHDRDADKLRYRWLLPNGTSVLPAAGGRTITQVIPNAAGDYEFTAVAFDGRGGYAIDRIKLSTLGVLFSGTVTATDQPVVPGARVEVNGTTATTDARGRFRLVVREAPRYVLNIRHSGYALVSRIYDNSVTRGRWELTRASVHIADPALPIDVVNERKPDDCRGSLEDRRKRDRDRTCGPGIRVRIPADSLVDSAGNPPAGSVEIELSTVDLRSPDAMPGDFGARTAAGTVGRMDSFGAGTVELRSGGREVNLKPGAAAEVVIPIDAAQLASPTPPPATVPLLQYDEAGGIWVEEGTMSRVGSSYVGKVTHFSAINADLVFSNYACVRVEAQVMPASFKLEAKVTPSGSSEKVLTTLVDNSSQRFHTVYRLPTNTPVQLTAYNPDTNAPIPLLGAGGVSVNFVTVSSGGLQAPQDPFTPVYPYTACRSAVELIPFRLPPETRDTFLAGLFSFNASNLTELDVLDPTQASAVRAAAADYYKTVDPQDRRLTLAGFRSANGFGSGTGVEFDAQYANAGDLGFGRDMHCRKDGSDVACYVTNYGDRFTDNVLDATNAKLDHDTPGTAAPVATVGMEYTRVENVSGTGFQQRPGGGDLRIVKFYVFGGDGTRVVSANLDGFGQRPVPALCMVCHGGRYPTPAGTNGVPVWNTSDANSGDLGSNFIPFDFLSFELPIVTLPGGGTVDLKASQEGAFKNLNQQIVLATSPPAATQAVIAGMYAGGSSTQITDFAVTGWQGTAVAANQVETYKKVVAPSCRSCHISQGPSTPEWTTASQFDTYGGVIDALVCTSHFMPHAIETHDRFWLSLGPHQPLVMRNFLAAVRPSGTTWGDKCVP